MITTVVQGGSEETWCIFGDRSPRHFGGGVPYFALALMEEDGRFATGLAVLQLLFIQRGEYVPHHVDGRIILDGSDGQGARWETLFAELPKRKFQRKKRRLSFELRGDPRLDFNDSLYLPNITRENIKFGAEMLHGALAYAQSTLKPSDGVDLSEMIEAAAVLMTREWTSDEALRESLRVAYERNRARMDAMDPWSKINLSGAHPEARKILDDPSDWSEGDDFAPHGNDLGADILGSWPKLKNKSLPAIAKYFEVDLSANDAEASMARIQVTLAIAFGHVKKSGKCSQDVALQALRTLQDDQARASELVGLHHRSGWDVACARYMAMLEKLAFK